MSRSLGFATIAHRIGDRTVTDAAELGTVLGVWAHPDDEAFLTAGLMAAARENRQRVVCVTATLGERGTPSHTEIVKGVQRNICRCGTYPRIVRAVERGVARSGSHGDRRDPREDYSQGNRGGVL